MVDSYWPWRALRWRDCDEALVGMRRTGEDEIAVIVASGIHLGKEGIWTNQGRIWGVPDWVWDRVGIGEMWAGTISGFGAVAASQADREQIVAVHRGEITASEITRDEPLIFERGTDGSTQLVEQQAGLVEFTAGQVTGWGWMIFPIPPNSKIPFGGSHGYKDAVSSTDAAKVRAHWKMWPEDNIALATGQGKHTPVVIDIDPRNGGSIEQAEALFGVPLGYTLTASTPSGGVHLYFTDPLQGKENALRSVNSGQFTEAPGIEVKAAGRHVVMPPSQYQGACYAWTNGSIDRGPAILPVEVRAKAAKAAARRADTFSRGDDPFSWKVPLEYILHAVRESAFNGRGRNNMVHEAACVICAQSMSREECDNDLATMREVAMGTGLPEYEVDKAIRSARQRLVDTS